MSGRSGLPAEGALRTEQPEGIERPREMARGLSAGGRPVERPLERPPVPAREDPSGRGNATWAWRSRCIQAAVQ